MDENVYVRLYQLWKMFESRLTAKLTPLNLWKNPSTVARKPICLISRPHTESLVVH